MGVIKRIACTVLSAMMMLSFGAIGANAEDLSSSSEDSLSLAWDIVDEADGYVIYRIDDSGELQEIANVEECGYTDESLEPNTEYNYIVKPYKTEDENNVWLENGEQQLSLKTGSETNETISRNDDNSKAEMQETKSFKSFAKAVTQMTKKHKSEKAETSGKGERAVLSGNSTSRIIVQTNGNEISFDGYNAQQIVKGPNGIYVAQFDNESDAEYAVDQLNGDDNVQYAEMDCYASGCADEESESISYNSWGIEAMGADKYAEWTAANTQEELIVAMVDSGIDSDHPYFEGKIAEGGYDFIDDDDDPEDEYRHGTCTAGIVLETTQGLNVKVLPVRVLDSSTVGTSLSVGNGVRYAADSGAKVINMSLRMDEHSEYVDESIKYAVGKGCVVVIAAANDKQNIDECNCCPSHVSEAITVGAIDSSYNIASFSNYGSTLDIAAPGVKVKSCELGGGYSTRSGTSASTAHVSGAAAMIRLMNPEYTPEDVLELIKENAKDLGDSGWDEYYGWGAIQLENLPEPNGIKIESTEAEVGKGESIALKAYALPNYASRTAIKWSSSDDSTATVDESGNVTGIKFGSAVIKAETKNGYAASCTVTVKQTPTSVTLSKTSATISKGSTLTLSATVAPSNAENKTLTWSSSNTAVATVNSSGKVTAKSGGTATITAKTANGKTASCKITVRVYPTAIKLSKTSGTIDVGKTLTLKATYTPSDTTVKTLTWSSSNTKVATVNSSGKVTAKKVGTATITAKTSNGKKAVCKITVKKFPTKVTLSKTSAKIRLGKTLQLKATVSPSSATTKTVTWSSSNTKVATVSSSGKVTAKKVGKATITAKTHNGLTATCVVDVQIYPTGLRINQSNTTLKVGKTLQMTVNVYPTNATDKTIKWSSINTKVATVSSSGKVTAKKKGTAKITAKSWNGYISTRTITVK